MEQNDEVVETSPESTEEVAEVVETEVESQPKPDLEKVIGSLKREKTKLEKELLTLKSQKPTSEKSLDVEDYINISASLEGLDLKEKEFLAEQHKLSGKPISELRKSETFELWQEGRRAKVEKEKTLKPSGGQPEVSVPKSDQEILRSGTVSEKEAVLKKWGMLKDVRKRPDSVTIR